MPSKTNDRQLGAGLPTTRRDFLNGVGITVGVSFVLGNRFMVVSGYRRTSLSCAAQARAGGKQLKQELRGQISIRSIVAARATGKGTIQGVCPHRDG